METKDMLEKVARDMQNLRAQREVVARKVSGLLFQWSQELSPLVEFMRKNQIPFGNEWIEGSTMQGILLADGFVNTRRVFYVYETCYLRVVDALSDEFLGNRQVETDSFLNTCDLEIAKAGFDYVRNIDTTAVQWYYRRNQELERFLQENSADT